MQQALQKPEIVDTVYKNRYLILAIILLGSFMGGLDATMAGIALPTITAHFNVSLAQSQWIMTGYLLSMTGLFIFFGKVSEYTGRTKLFLAGWVLFTISSLACGFAGSLEQLIIFRIIQGIGASMVSCIGGALIFEVFPPQERGKAMGLFAVVFGASALVGPGLGGFLIDNSGWQSIFLINVPIGIILLAFALKYMRFPEVTTQKLEMDWIGAGTLFLAVVSLMMVCSEIAKGMTVTPAMIAYATVFVLSSIAFLMQESRCRKPLLDLSIFGNRKFTLPILSAMLLFIPISIANTLGPFYFQGVMGYTPSQVGLLSMVVPLFMMFAAPASGMMYDKRHGKYQAAAGVLISAAGFIMLGFAFLAANIWLVILAFVIRGIGGGIFGSPNNVEIMSALTREKTAIASSVSSTATFMAVMLGVAVSSILLTVELNMSGYYGPTFMAGSSLLAGSIGTITIITGALCFISAAVAVLRNI